MGFSFFRTSMTVLICLFLLMLFVLPPRYISAFADEADALLASALEDLERGDDERALRSCEALTALISDSMPALERFLIHSDVDSLESAFNVAKHSIRIKDAGTAAQALAEARAILSRLKGIELFSWNNLL